MRLPRLLLPAILAAAVAAGVALAPSKPAGGELTPSKPAGGELSPSKPVDPRPGAGPAVALLVTRPGAGATSLHVAHAGDASPGPPVATFDHAEDAVVRGSVLPGTAVVLATADVVRARDAPFGAALFLLSQHHPPELLVDRIAHAGRPLVTASGRVFVSRGWAGPDVPGAIRVDELGVDEIDPATGSAHTVLSASGYLLSLVGSFDREVLVYRVLPTGADLAAFDPGSGAVRLVVPHLLPYARDFSIDEAAGAVVFEGRDEVDSRAFTVERVDLATGARRRLYTSAGMSLAPFAWPGGGVALSREGQGGIALLGGTRPLAAGLLGPGVDQVQAISAGGAWVAGLHTAAGQLPVAFAIDTRTGTAASLPSPAGARPYIAGFVEEGVAPGAPSIR